MANGFLVSSPILGLMGAASRTAGRSLLPFPQQPTADAYDELMFQRAGNGYVQAPTGEFYAAGSPQMAQMSPAMPQAPAQRERVNPLNVLFRGLAPNLSGALDRERQRLQAEADRPQMLAIQQENERIARALGPQALLALRTNPQALGESVGYQYRPTTTTPGGISTVFGTGQQVSAPRDIEFGNDLVRSDPLLPDVQTLRSRGPSYSEQAQIARIQQDAEQAAARLNLDYQRLGQDQQQFEQRLAFDQSKQEAKPLTAAQSRQLESYLGEIETAQTINSELGRFDQLLANGELNLGPVTNLRSGALNRLGISDPNSTNYAEFRSTLERLRNDSLRLNNGVQTEGDAQRAWNELISNINDEKVVRRQIQRIQNLNERAIQFRQGRVDALESGRYIQGQGAQSSNIPPPPPGFELDR